jgi:CHAT domain-containing protein
VQALEESIRIHDSSGAVTEAVEARAELAQVKTAMGSLDEARVLLTRASKDAQSAGTPATTRGLLALSRGDLAVEFGTFTEASNEYASALSSFRIAADSAGIARATEAIALLLHERGNKASASRLMREASSLRRKSGDRRSAAMTNLTLAEMLIASEDFPAARNSVRLAFESFRDLGDVVGQAAALAVSGDIFRHTTMPESASAAYRRGLKLVAGRNAADVEWRLHTDLGRTLRRTGDLNAAAVELRAAIAIAERTAAGVRLEERRAGFNADKWIAYRELALVELGRHHAGEAFAVSERLRARQMVDLLARGRITFPGQSTREQDTRRKIALLTRELEKSVGSYPRVREPRLDPRPPNDIRSELNRAQSEYATQLATMRETSPAYARLVSGSTRTWQEIAARLKPDQVLLEYLLTDSASVVFVVTTDGVAAVDLHTSEDQIADLVEFSRRTIEQTSRRGTQRLWRVPLRRLYSALIQPVESKGYLRGRKTLLVTPHSELHLLSFASLIDPVSGKYLVDRFDIAYAPSATVWAQLKDRPSRPTPAGVLAMAPNIRSLPGTRDEVGRIARIYGNRAIVRTGSAATPQELRSRLASSGTVHLATFGVLNRHNPLFSFIELAPDARGDGHLTVSEVFGLPMSGQLVVLSACQTAVGSGSLADVPPGDDWIGLVQAFLQAGANTVLASLWPVDDQATADLMARFHRERMNGASTAAAIASAQRAMLRDKATADPFYWAAFAAVGRAE